MAKPQQPDATIEADHFVQSADANTDPTLNEGRVPVLEDDGNLHPRFIKLGTLLYAGETLTGATTPVPVYQNKSDNELYQCEANDTDKMKYIGFVISNSTDGNPVFFQGSGIVSGFTSLEEGQKYYLQNDGSIDTSPGDMEILVGIAVSTTELLIQKSRRFKSGSTTFNSTSTQVVTLGFRPSVVRIKAVLPTNADGGNIHSDGSWSASGGQRCVRATNNDSGAAAADNDTSNAWNTNTTLNTGGSRGTVTTITDTGFTLNNVRSQDTTYLYWEAEGEL